MVKENPLEEVTEVYQEVHHLERDFQKALSMCKHLLHHTKGQHDTLLETTEKLDKLKLDNHMMAEKHSMMEQTVKKQSETNLHQQQIEQSESEQKL